MPKSNIVKIAESKAFPAWLSELPEDGSVIDVIANKFRKVIELEEAAAAAVEAIVTSYKLTDKGKKEERAERGADFLAKHEELAKDIDEVIPGLVSKAKAKAAKSEESEVMQAARMNRATATYQFIAAEVGTDNLALEAKLAEAEAAGDAETLSAILDAPQSWPLTGVFDRDKLTARRDAITGGGTSLIDTAQSDLQDRLDWAAAGIRADAGLGEEDNILAIANSSDDADAT